MKTFTSLFIGVALSSLFIACGNGSSSSTPAAGAVSLCPLGSTQQGVVCVGANGAVVSQVPSTGNNPGIVRFYSENWSTRNLEVAFDDGQDPTATFPAFVRDALGVCGPYTANPDCGPWNSGAFDIVLMSDNVQSNQLTAVFRLKPRDAGYGFPELRFPLGFTLSVTNNYQGFEARANGDINSPASRSMIQIQVATGKLEDASFNYRIAYRGHIIINGRFDKCSADCGLSKSIGN